MKSNQAIPLTERPTLTVDEFCKLIGIGRSTAYKAIAAGDLKVRKYGKRTFVTQDRTEAVCREHAVRHDTTASRVMSRVLTDEQQANNPG